MAKPTSVDAMFFAAHADDIELACGGTIAKLVRDGRRAGIVDLTRGEMGTRGTPETRLRESQASARILGATFREQFDFGDGGLRTGRDEEMQIIDIVRRWRPSIVFAPWPDERHPDHSRSGRLVAERRFTQGCARSKRQLPAHRPQAVVYYIQNYLPPLSFVMDVSEAWETKMKAVRCYKSQFFDRKSNRERSLLKKGFWR